ALQRWAADYYPEFEKEKIVWQEIVSEPSFAYDDTKIYCEATSFIMTGENLKYILGLLNSKPVSFFFRTYYAGGGLGSKGYRYKKFSLEKVPIPLITSENQDKVREIEKKVNDILNLVKSDNYDNDKEKQNEVARLEKEIDQLVYQLYDLTNEEIKTEGSKK
ncbi:MAG: TaqI-like C-terminal specificity domain-containing protein, partial [Dictyoglomus sp.]